MNQPNDELDPPFEIIEPEHWRGPVLFNSPHSGRVYPREFLRSSRLDLPTLRFDSVLQCFDAQHRTNSRHQRTVIGLSARAYPLGATAGAPFPTMWPAASINPRFSGLGVRGCPYEMQKVPRTSPSPVMSGSDQAARTP